MKVIQFTPYFPPHKGGLEVVAQNISKYLVAGQHAKVINITSSIGQISNHKDPIKYCNTTIGYKEDGYEVICMPSFEIIHNFPCPKIWTRKFRMIIKYIKAQKGDIIQTHTRFFLQTFMGIIIGKVLHIPIVHVEHGSGFVTGIAKRKEKIARLYDQSIGRLSFILADKIVSINKKNKEFICQFVKPDKCETIYNGIEQIYFPSKQEKPDNNNIKLVFIGRLIRLKGVRFLLEACKLLVEKGIENFHLDIIGDGDEKADLEHLMRRLRLQQHVTFLGAKNHDDIINEILPKADILINPSLQEGLPTTVLEGLLAGCVVVATDVGGTNEISSEPDLILVKAGDYKELAENLEHTIANYKLLQGKSVSHIKEKFNWAKSVEKYAKCYNEQKGQDKIFRINPVSHFVYQGWMYFFNKFFSLEIYDHGEKNRYGKHHHLMAKKIVSTGTNPICFYDKTNFGIQKNDIVIIGDIFVNTLCYSTRGKNVIYYSEYFNDQKAIYKKIIFFCIGYLFFRNRKFILPTSLAVNTFKKISKKIFYLPQIYEGELFKNKHIGKDTVKILFVGRISQKFKNIDFLIKNYLQIKEKYNNISLTLVGKLYDEDFLSKYEKELTNGTIIYLGEKNMDELDVIYTEYDIFVLPSNSDPIGSVIQEAMAHELAVLASDTVGASGYIENGRNGFIFQTNNDKDFQKKLTSLIKDPNGLLASQKQESFKIIKEKYRYKNDQLMADIHKDFITFLNS